MPSYRPFVVDIRDHLQGGTTPSTRSCLRAFNKSSYVHRSQNSPDRSEPASQHVLNVSVQDIQSLPTVGGGLLAGSRHATARVAVRRTPDLPAGAGSRPSRAAAARAGGRTRWPPRRQRSCAARRSACPAGSTTSRTVPAFRRAAPGPLGVEGRAALLGRQGGRVDLERFALARGQRAERLALSETADEAVHVRHLGRPGILVVAGEQLPGGHRAPQGGGACRFVPACARAAHQLARSRRETARQRHPLGRGVAGAALQVEAGELLALRRKEQAYLQARASVRRDIRALKTRCGRAPPHDDAFLPPALISSWRGPTTGVQAGGHRPRSSSPLTIASASGRMA